MHKIQSGLYQTSLLTTITQGNRDVSETIYAANTKFQEEYSAKIPALSLLNNLGWRYVSPDEALQQRAGKPDEVVLREVLRQELSKRRFEFEGKTHALSATSIDKLITQLCSPVLNEGLLAANETLYNHMVYGIAVTEFVNGNKATPTIAIIDWHNIDNNDFCYTEEMVVSRANGIDHRKPDIVCFVNGLPWVVIEAKRPDAQAHKGPTVEEGISQNIRNQQVNEIQRLFAYSQLLLSINGFEGRYGTCGTAAKFWAAWREEDFSDEAMHVLKNQAVQPSELQKMFAHRPAHVWQWYQDLLAGGELKVTGQDRLIISLLTPARLLEIMRLFTFFDKKAGKVVARYHQVFGLKRLIERINTKKPQGGREGGVIWHTTGSGKSFTMVFLSKALILKEALKQCRLVIVTDRVDLESQLSNSFASSGEFSNDKEHANSMATSGKILAEQIGKGKQRIVFSLIQKFNSAIKFPECVNTSEDIIVLIDEGHRSQGGENHIKMTQALPNASFVAFTGTPLLKEEKTVSKFGKIVHAYTMQRAVEDQTVTPLLYEERIPDLEVNARAIDNWFERITEGLSDEQKTDLKRKFAKKGQVYSADDRIRLIAWDIADHFVKNIDEGLKGQLACDSKASAIKYKQYLDEIGLFESAVVMSAPDTRADHTDIDETGVPEVAKWWQDNVGTQDEKEYTKNIVKRFEEDSKLKLLIVVDKLLTGFDEPKNAVLYIDKPLKEHNLIQAIARVNRLHDQKKFGLLIDYRGILAELDTTIADYQNLAAKTQGGYDINDIDGLYHQMSTEYKRLPRLHKSLWAIFENVKNKADIEQLRQVLVPRLEIREGESFDVHLKVRDDFYQALSEFASCLKVALQSKSFFEDTSFTEKNRQDYKDTLKLFTSLRQWVKQDAGETVDYDEYSEQVKKLLDKHVVGVGIKESINVYEVGKFGKMAQPEDWSEEKTRNETDTIKTRVAKTIEQSLRDDPYAQEAFSKLLRLAIEEAEKHFDYPLKQYLLFKEFEEQVEARRLHEIPDVFQGNRHAQAYFGILKKVLPETLHDGLTESEQMPWVTLAFDMDAAITLAVAENSINPQNIEADIRKKLLPMMFQACRSIGGGVDQAKIMVEMVVQVVRLGWKAV